MSASRRVRVTVYLFALSLAGALAAGSSRADAGAAGSEAAPADWRAPGRDAAGTYHAALTSINTSTVGRLGFAWQYRLGTFRGQEATPLVIDGVLYTSGNFGRVYAVDAATGRERWTYDPDIDGQFGRYGCCDAVNRGLAAWKGRLFVMSMDGYLHALDAATGRRLWKVDTLPARGAEHPYSATGAPVVAGDQVVVGNAGGDFKGVRGYLAAFDATTGQLHWRFYTVPRDPALGAQDQPHLGSALASWDAHYHWDNGAGGTIWDGIAYDAPRGLIYAGTGNPSPYNKKEGGLSGGDQLFTDCLIAIDAKTGSLRWFYQTVPGDMWDFDSTQKMILADLPVGGRSVPVLMQAAKNGYFYVLNREDGTLLSAHPYAYQNWSRGIDRTTGRPIPNPAVDYSAAPRLIFPSEAGAHSWQPMSYDPDARRVFIPVEEVGNVIIDTSRRSAGLVDGQFASPAFRPEDYDPQAMASLYGPLPALASLERGLPRAPREGFIRAWDPVHQRLAWQVKTASGWDSGLLSTAGGLVFQGDVTGRMNVYRAADGTLLKSIELGSSFMAAPMSYEVNGVQYIAVVGGYGGSEMGLPFPETSAAYRYGNEGRIIALRLDGGAAPLPPTTAHAPFPQPPPRQPAPAGRSGEVLYNRYCSRCHVFGEGLLPDLRRLSASKHALFNDIVLNGALKPLGMGSFQDVLSPADVDAIHAYLIDEAWHAYDAAAPGHAAP